MTDARTFQAVWSALARELADRTLQCLDMAVCAKRRGDSFAMRRWMHRAVLLSDRGDAAHRRASEAHERSRGAA